MAASELLTDKAIRAALKAVAEAGKPRKVSDGAGLVLDVRPTGAGWWRLRYWQGGKEMMLSLGTYPDTSLAQARAKRDEARRQLAAGLDPSAERKAGKAAAEREQEAQRRAAAGEAQEGSFEAVALEWHRVQSSRWASPSTGERVLARFKKDVFPYIGARPVGELTPPELLAVFERIQARGVIETAHRARSECGQVFRFAVRKGWALSDPCRDLAGALATPTVRHFSAITDPVQLAQFLKAADGYTGTPTVRAALKLTPMLFTRPGELRGAQWDEFDLAASTWAIPAARMKRNRHDKLNGEPHIVPLPRQAVAVLKGLQPLTEASGWVFPGEHHRDKPFSENTINAAMRALGFDRHTVTGHGFRATARTMLAERLGEPEAVIEAQLAHSVPDALGRAYNRTQWADKRRTMMQAWVDYLDRLRVGGDVVALPSRAA